MPRIEELQFTKLVSGGKVYRAPCIVYPDSVDGRWWRSDGGRFAPGDFDSVVEKQPDIVILGRGLLNKVEVMPETLQRFAAAGIECEVLDSNQAADRYNELLAAGKKVVAAFHLM